MLMNKVFIAGRLGKDPVVKPVGEGSVANYSIAVSRYVKKTKEYKSDWFDITSWGQGAEYASKNFTKGDEVFIEGRLNLSEWEKDGVKNRKYTITAERQSLVGKAKAKTDAAPAESNNDQEIPF